MMQILIEIIWTRSSAGYRTQQMEKDYIGPPKLSYTRRSRQKSIGAMMSQISTKSNGLFLPATKLPTRNGSLSMKLFEMHNTVSCSVQQVCLDNKKWLIIDQEPPFCFRNMSNISNMQGLLKSKRSGKKLRKKSQLFLKQTLVAKKQKCCNNQSIAVREDIKKGHKDINISMTRIQKKNLRGYYKSPRLQCERSDQCKSNQQTQLKHVRKLKHSAEKTLVRFENGGSKSNKSKTNKTNRTDKTDKTSKSRRVKKINEINKIPTNGNILETDKDPQPTPVGLNVEEKKVIQNKNKVASDGNNYKIEDKTALLVILKLYDPIELLNCNIFTKKITSNYYQSYPEWLSIPSENVQHQQDPQQASIQNNPKKIPIEHLKENRQTSRPCLEDLPLQKSMQASNQFSLQNPIPQPVDNIVAVTNPINFMKIQQYKMQSGVNGQIPLVEKQRILTTKGTDNCNSTVIHVQNQLPADKNVSFVDKDYCLYNQFETQPSIRLINIHPNNQTALFPMDPKNHLIIASAKQSPFYGQYSNSQLINFLNFILIANPKLLELVFETPTNKGYNCLIHKGSTVQKITVDGYFPFDVNYYPLFGRVEQYIWLAVLLKSIAKLKGSYKEISHINFQEIYLLLTGDNFENITQKLVQLQNPIKSLAALRRQENKSNKFVLFICQDSFFKLEKVIVNKKNPQGRQQENQFRSMCSKHIQKTGKGSNQQEEDYKFLNIFLQEMKEQIVCREIKESAVLKLRGCKGIKQVSWKQIMAGSYQIYVAKPWLQKVGPID